MPVIVPYPVGPVPTLLVPMLVLMPEHPVIARNDIALKTAMIVNMIIMVMIAREHIAVEAGMIIAVVVMPMVVMPVIGRIMI